jgi:hypothetical protein
MVLVPGGVWCSDDPGRLVESAHLPNNNNNNNNTGVSCSLDVLLPDPAADISTAMKNGNETPPLKWS